MFRLRFAPLNMTKIITLESGFYLSVKHLEGFLDERIIFERFD